MNSTIFSYQYGLMDICFIFCIKSTLLNFVAQIVAALAPSGALSAGLCAPHQPLINVGVFVCLLSTSSFSELHDAPGSSYMIPALALRMNHFSGADHLSTFGLTLACN